VEESDIRRLEAQRAALKREWEALLRTEPTLSPLGNPDTLVYMMDETIDRLLGELRQGVAPRDGKGQVTPLQRRCACGLNPLLNYYATGELAVHAIAGQTCGAGLEDAVSAFHAIARKEIDTLCSVCCYRHHHAPHPKSQLAV
jgi:hypothetical protein